MYKKLIGIMVFACSLIISQSLFAHGHGVCGDGLKKMIASLNLDAAQMEKIKPILEQLKATAQEKGMQMGDLDKQIKEQILSGKMDQDTVNGLVDKKSALIGDIIKAKINTKAQILAILNPEQKTVLQNKMQEAEDKMAAKFKKCQDDD